mgnify:CR=1 FL=1
MNIIERVDKINELLRRDFPTVETPLFHKDAFTLLVAVVLSAQTLDSSVSKVTPVLWSRYPTMKDLSIAEPAEVAEILYGINYKFTKARNIINLSRTLIEKFKGEIPHTIETLTTLPGVGRKTANVVINQWFAKGKAPGISVLPEGFVVDTHVKRVAKRLGLTNNTEPEKVEQDLMKLFPRPEWDDVALRMIYHGRTMCTAKNPKCYLDAEWSQICGCVNEVKVLSNPNK